MKKKINLKTEFSLLLYIVAIKIFIIKIEIIIKT